VSDAVLGAWARFTKAVALDVVALPPVRFVTTRPLRSGQFVTSDDVTLARPDELARALITNVMPDEVPEGAPAALALTPRQRAMLEEQSEQAARDAAEIAKG